MTSPTLYRLEVPGEGDGGSTTHTILDFPATPPGATSDTSVPYYNIAMFDVSGSMKNVWSLLVTNWNNVVAPCLNGQTDIYTFGTEVRFRRKGTQLQQSDFDSTLTNLSGALIRINEQIKSCPQNNVRVFLISDGHHNCEGSPEQEISKLRVLRGKSVEVYMLGIGKSFPVNYSVDIRSKLHNGSAACPILFWVRRSRHEIVHAEMTKIRDEILKGRTKLNLSLPGKVMPLVGETKTKIYAGELVYYEKDPSEIISKLKVATQESVTVSLQQHVEVRTASAEFLVSSLFKQWNAVLVHRHRTKKVVPMEIFELMRKIFDLQISRLGEPGNSTIKDRLHRKNIATLKLKFDALVKQSRSIISTQSTFEDELQLAEAILKSTVQSRYDSKLFQLRGHGTSEWLEDVQTFKTLYTSMISQINAIPEPPSDDCCRITMCSFIGDLKDPNFMDVLNLDKFEFLTTMTFTGIPIFAPVKDSAQINPWTLHIENICTSPFNVLSQGALESALEVGMDSSNSKEIQLQPGNENSMCNAVVPIIPKEHCSLLKPLVRTNLFSVGATFSILKNPMIVDHTCHLAALACVWTKTISDYPAAKRPEFIVKRISDIEETAKIYMDRPSIVNYMTALASEPSTALMTESDFDDGKVLKCESMVKPMFLIHLARDEIAKAGKEASLLKLLLVEFLGRCLSSYTSEHAYMDLFLTEDMELKRQNFLINMRAQVKKSVRKTGDDLLKHCYTRADVKKHVYQIVTASSTKAIAGETHNGWLPVPKLDKVERLRHSGSAGPIGWKDLRAWADEMTFARDNSEPLFSKKMVEESFDDKMVCGYIHHALEHRHSKDRMKTPLRDAEEAFAEVQKKLTGEVESCFRSNLLSSEVEALEARWQEAYDRLHQEVALPLTRFEIIAKAQEKGIHVDEANFHQVYKYREGVMLCSNSCQVVSCPYFLLPDRRFHRHIQAERGSSHYPHGLHLIVSKNPAADSRELVKRIQGRQNASNKKDPTTSPRASHVLAKQVKELQAMYRQRSIVNGRVKVKAV